MTKTLTRDEKDDLAASRVEHIMETVGPKFDEDKETIDDVMEAFLYAAHFTNTSVNPEASIFDTLSKITKLVAIAKVDRAIEKLALAAPEAEVEAEVEEEVRPEVSE